MELAEGRTYVLAPGRKFAAFTWYGAELVLGGAVAGVYVSPETHMPLYANLHQRLEVRREEAKAAGTSADGSAAAVAASHGPRVLVVGPTDSGKSTLCRTLVAYACRVGRSPIFVDLDLGQGDVSVPGTLAAVPLDRASLSVEETSVGGGTGSAPLVFYVGHTTAHESMPVVRNAMARLGDAVSRRLSSLQGEAGLSARASGLVINSSGWVDGGGYDLTLASVTALGVDVVVVLGNDRLFAALVADVKVLPRRPNQLHPITVVKLPRSGGVVERPAEVRRAARKARLHDYFYGRDGGPGMPPLLSPEIVTVPWGDVTIVRVGGTSGDPSLVPIGKASAIDALRVQTVTPGPALLNAILGVSYAPAPAADARDARAATAVPHSNVAGFVHVRAVNVEAKTLTLLAPAGGALPGRFLILGSLSWVET